MLQSIMQSASESESDDDDEESDEDEAKNPATSDKPKEIQWRQGETEEQT